MLRPPTVEALTTFGVAVALGALATATVFARFLARRRTKTKYLADDYVTLVAWVFMMGLIVNAGLRTFSFSRSVVQPWLSDWHPSHF